jgi:hypothetical protein
MEAPDSLGAQKGLEKLSSITIPQPQLDEPPDPYVSSEMDLAEHIRVMRARKDYSDGNRTAS